MQTANIMLDIGGDNGNQIKKRGVTAAEIAVLIAIHGEAAVHDIEPAGDVPTVNLGEGDVRWTNRVELQRLRARYGRAKNGEDQSHVDILFPGAAARVFETIDELNLPEEFFKPTARAGLPKKAAPVEDELEDAPVEITDDGVEDMEPASAEKPTATDAAEITPPPAPTPPADETDSLFK